MEESLFLLKTLFEEDSDFVLNNSQNGLNTDLDLENIFTIISKGENEINIIKEKEKKKNEKEENNKLEKIKLKKLESIQTEYSSAKEDIPQLTKKKIYQIKKSNYLNVYVEKYFIQKKIKLFILKISI